MTFDEWWEDDDLLADQKELAARAFAAGAASAIPKLHLTTEQVIAANDLCAHRFCQRKPRTPITVALITQDGVLLVASNAERSLYQLDRMYPGARWSDPIPMPKEGA
jgi:hypothetical protein